MGKTLKDKKDKTDMNPYTSIHLHRTTWDELKRLKGKGISHDRFIRDLIELPPLERKRDEQEQKAGDCN